MRTSPVQAQPPRPPRYHSAFEFLACPTCGGDLVEVANPIGLHCEACGGIYPVESGVPLLLTDVSRDLLASGKAPSGLSLMPAWLPNWLAHWIRVHCLAGPGEDRRQRSRLAAFVGEKRDGGLVVDLGSGSRRLADHVLNVEISSFPEVDLVGDAHQLPFRSSSVDRIVCTGILEHVNFPERVVSEMVRVLRPGGRVYVAVPFMQGFHPGSGTQQDFQRYTHVGLTQLLAPFRVVEWGISGGPSAALAGILREYLALPFAWSRPLYAVAYLGAGPLTSWLRWLDIVLDRFPPARRIACGFYMIGEKPDGTVASSEGPS